MGRILTAIHYPNLNSKAFIDTTKHTFSYDTLGKLTTYIYHSNISKPYDYKYSFVYDDEETLQEKQVYYFNERKAYLLRSKDPYKLGKKYLHQYTYW